MSPAHPDITVDFAGQGDKPVACVALVRRALQRHGHDEAAEAFTREALGGPTEDIVATARRYVTVVEGVRRREIHTAP